MEGQISGLRGWISTERVDLRPKGADYMPERVDLQHKGTDFWPHRADFRVERPDGGTNGQNDRWTNKSLLVFYWTLSPLGPLPKKSILLLLLD